MRAGRKQNRFVPVKPFLDAAIRFRLRRSSACMILQFQRHDMLRVPELARAAICNSRQHAATRWSPVRCEDRLPHYKHPHLSAGLTRQQLLSCGGPPQTGCSSRGKKKYQPGPFRGFVEGLFERREIHGSKRGERFLTGRRGRIHSQVHRHKKQCDHGKDNRDGFLLHFAALER